MRDLIKNDSLSALARGPLAAVSVVLVEPQNPMNIGGVARAMRNFGLTHLRLVKPRTFPNPEAIRMAVGGKRVVEAAEVFPSLDEALRDQSLALAFTRREGKARRPFLTPPDAARRVLETTSTGGSVSMVFGREDHGLSNASLRRCQDIAVIPSDPACASLNLAHAVGLVAYELFCEAARPHLATPLARAPIAELQDLLDHWQRGLLGIGFLDPKHPDRMMRYFERLFGRIQLTRRDVRILRGLAHQMEWAAGQIERAPATRKNRKQASLPAGEGVV